MKNEEAQNQLCKMVEEIASRMHIDHERIGCTCGTSKFYGRDVADEVIEEMWRRLTDPRWAEEEEDDH